MNFGKSNLKLLALGATAALMLNGCIFGSDADSANDGGTTIRPGTGPTAISMSETADETYTLDDSTITWTDNDIDCEEGGVLEESSYSWTEKYLISGDTLYTWEDYDCYADAFVGGGTSVEGGSWTSIGEVEIPDPDYASGCDEEPDSDVPEGLTGTSVLSGGQRVDTFTGELCFTDQFGFFAEGAEAVDCKTMEMELPDGETLTMSFESFDSEGGMDIKYTYGGKSCTQTVNDYSEPTEASCQAAWEAYQADADADDYFWYGDYDPAQVAADAEFESCMEDNGFPNMGGMM